MAQARRANLADVSAVIGDSRRHGEGVGQRCAVGLFRL